MEREQTPPLSNDQAGPDTVASKERGSEGEREGAEAAGAVPMAVPGQREERPRTSPAGARNLSRFLETKRRVAAARGGAGGGTRTCRHSSEWNAHFHVVQSKNNTASHRFYREYFDKPPRLREASLLMPFKFRDPYLTDPSRMPTRSKVFRPAQRTSEVQWRRDFAVMHSKNNEQLHPCYKEFFDSPVEYLSHTRVRTPRL